MSTFYQPINTTIIRGWCTRVLPLVYDDSLSYMEMICKIADYVNNIITDVNAVNTLAESLNVSYAEITTELDRLNTEIEKVKNGDYVSLYLDSIEHWIDANLQELVARMVKFVFFQINDSGYFEAVIPETWDFITFDTDYNPASETYLHLVLNY